MQTHPRLSFEDDGPWCAMSNGSELLKPPVEAMRNCTALAHAKTSGVLEYIWNTIFNDRSRECRFGALQFLAGSRRSMSGCGHCERAFRRPRVRFNHAHFYFFTVPELATPVGRALHLATWNLVQYLLSLFSTCSGADSVMWHELDQLRNSRSRQNLHRVESKCYVC